MEFPDQTPTQPTYTPPPSSPPSGGGSSDQVVDRQVAVDMEEDTKKLWQHQRNQIGKRDNMTLSGPHFRIETANPELGAVVILLTTYMVIQTQKT